MGTVLNWGNPLHKPYPLFLLGFGVITIYIPGIIGAATSTGWLFLFIVAPILFLYCKVEFGLGFLFLCYAALSLFWTETFIFGWFNFLQLVILGCIFCIGQNIKDLSIIFKGLVAGLGISCIAAINQTLGGTEIYTLNKLTAGLFFNPNIYGELSAILLVSLLVLKLWWWIPLTLPGLILAHSRTALLALAVGLFMWSWKLNKYLAIGLSSIVLLIGLVFYLHSFNVLSITERFDLWADTIQGFKIFGNGVGSFEVDYPLYATHINTELARPRYAHNDILNLIFEFGIGSILILMVLYNAFKTNRDETIILYTILIVSLFTYPMHVPATAFIAFLVTGYIVGNSNTNGNLRDNWGSTLSLWIKGKRFSEIGAS